VRTFGARRLWSLARRASAVVEAPARDLVRASRYFLSNPASGIVRLHAPNYVQPDPGDHDLVARIFESFVRMKADQSQARELYLPASIWEEQLARAYAPLRNALKSGDLSPFLFFLTNFGAWKEYTGITWSTTHQEAQSRARKLILQNETFLYLLRIWSWFYGGRKPVSALDLPRHGNHSGAFVDGAFVTISSFPLEVYGSQLARLAAGRSDRPVIAELGGGYGNLAYYTLSRQNASTYVDFDLPETLCVAAYYLLKSFPEKRALLYGEADYEASRHGEFDLVFMPNYAIEKLGSETVDVFANYASLGEMTREAVSNYVGAITNATKYFFHVNHDRVPSVYEDGSRGLLAYEYPIPPTFELLFRYPELFFTMYKGSFDMESNSFAYLYERKGVE